MKTKQVLLAIIFSVLLMPSTYAQTFEKSYHVGGMALMAKRSLMLSDGNILFLGCFSPSSFPKDVLVMKINANNGDTLWSRTIHKNALTLSVVDAVEQEQGNVFISINADTSDASSSQRKVLYVTIDSQGNTLQSFLCNPLSAQADINATGVGYIAQENQTVAMSAAYDSLGILIEKMASNGQLSFSKSIHPGISSNYGNMFDIMRKGNAYYMIGNVNFDSNQPDLLVIKLDTLGNVIWEKSSFDGFQGSLYIVSAKFIHSNDSSIMFVLGQGVSTALVKMDANGNLNYFKTYEYASNTGSVYQPYFKSCAKMLNGDLLLAGITDMQNNVNIGTHVGKPFIIRTDSNGTVLWSKKYAMATDMNSVTLIAASQNNDLFLGGSIYNEVSLNNSNFTSRFYVLRLDSAGNLPAVSCNSSSVYNVTVNNQAHALYTDTFLLRAGLGSTATNIAAHAIHPSVSSVGLLPNVSIGMLPNFVCEGDTTHVVASALNNAGTNPTLHFYVNHILVQSGSSTSYASANIHNGDTLVCEIVSNAACVFPNTALSGKVIAKIYPTENPTIQITDSSTSAGDPSAPIIFKAITTNEGPTPTYFWTRNGIHVGGNNATYYYAAPQDGDSISCELTSSGCAPNSSAKSNTIHITMEGIRAFAERNNGMMLYPNPTNHLLHLRFDDPISGTLNIRDLGGKLCFQQAIQQSSVEVEADVKPGFYFVEVISNNKIMRSSFVKE
jgi:hypothetical protein